MTKHDKKTVYTSLVVMILIIIAVICRFYSRSPDTPFFLNKLFNVLRTAIYFGLLSAWGLSIYRRVMQTQTRRLLTASAVLMVTWVLLRAFKHYFVLNQTAVRYLWYSYYIPLLLIPTLALFVALSIGKYEGRKLPNQALFLFIPVTVLIGLVLTNDLHQWVFRFPENNAVWTENQYSYGWGYFLSSAWGISCGIISLVILFIKSRLPKRKWVMWIPIITCVVATVYIVMYALQIPFVRAVVWDFAIFECLIFTVFFESCIQSGLIQSNTRYAEIFRASRGISVQIVDSEYNIQYSSENAESIEKDNLILAECSPVVLNEEKLLHNMPIRGGRAIWTEDISELLSLQSELEEMQAELKDRKEVYEQKYRLEEEHRIVEEQNRLYDLLQSKTQRQIDKIEKLIKEYGKVDNNEEKRRILAKIIVLGSYIKRRKNFVLLTDYTPTIPEVKLTNALAESFRALSQCGIMGTYSVNIGKKFVPGDMLALAYDFFEEVMESAIDKAKYLVVCVSEIKGTPRIGITLDCNPNTKVLRSAYPQMIAESEEGETILCLPLTGGVV